MSNDTLADRASSQVVKLLNIGESKSGKTGALASLAKAGYRLWILDYDNGLDILANVLRADTDSLKRVSYKTLRDEIVSRNGVLSVKPPPTAFKAAARALESWKADTFTADDIIVVDTLTTFSEAAFRQALFQVNRLNQRPQQTDWGIMADAVMLFIDNLTGPELRCNVIVNTHIRFFTGDDDTQTQARGMPNAMGQQIPRTVSRFFNTVVLTRSVGNGPATRRRITTQPQGVIEVATSNPTGVKPEYPIESGMADLFADILGHKGPSKTPTPAPVVLEPLKEEENVA
jgi:hypothetical protein